MKVLKKLIKRILLDLKGNEKFKQDTLNLSKELIDDYLVTIYKYLLNRYPDKECFEIYGNRIRNSEQNGFKEVLIEILESDEFIKHNGKLPIIDESKPKQKVFPNIESNDPSDLVLVSEIRQEKFLKYNSSLAVYSCYFGSNENKTFCAKKVNKSIPHIFYSNNKKVLKLAKEVGWITKFINIKVSDDPIVCAQQSKKIKALPHLLNELNDYEFIFYKDDKLDIDLQDILKILDDFKNINWSCALPAHPFLKGNILKEFGESMLQPRYFLQKDSMVDYITERLRENLSLNAQLYATGLILRNNNNSDTVSINNSWYENILQCGIECQLSFDFIAQNYQTIKILPIKI